MPVITQLPQPSIYLVPFLSSSIYGFFPPIVCLAAGFCSFFLSPLLSPFLCTSFFLPVHLFTTCIWPGLWQEQLTPFEPPRGVLVTCRRETSRGLGQKWTSLLWLEHSEITQRSWCIAAQTGSVEGCWAQWYWFSKATEPGGCCSFRGNFGTQSCLLGV